MLGPSGFFLPTEMGSSPHESNDIELIHSSENGFSELYRVCKNGRFFVYKALKEEYRGKLLYENLLDKDFNIGFSLSHISVCQYFAKISHPTIGSCIVMEWIDGQTLENMIRSNTLESRLCRKIICEICDALDYIHRKQIIHRDLKPENIMITHNGQNVKIIDFGLSDTDSYATLKAPAGTRHYAAPELIAGKPVDARCDIWSLGVIINEMSRNYRHVTAHCLQQEIDKRYRSAYEVKADFLRTGIRKLRRVLMILAAASAVTAAFFLLFGKGEVPEVILEDTIDTEVTTGSSTPKEDVVKEEPNELKKTKQPQAKPAVTSTENRDIDIDELEQLFKDAAETML